MGLFTSSLAVFVVWLCSAGNTESPCAGSWLSSTRLYMITRASAGSGWVMRGVCPLSAPCCHHWSVRRNRREVWLSSHSRSGRLTACGVSASRWRQNGVSVASHLHAAPLTLTRSHLADVVGWMHKWMLVFLITTFVTRWQKMEAAYYDNIIEQQRIEPEFFRMGFYGRKFPFFLRVRLAVMWPPTPPHFPLHPSPTASDTLRNPLMLLSHAEEGDDVGHSGDKKNCQSGQIQWSWIHLCWSSLTAGCVWFTLHLVCVFT